MFIVHHTFCSHARGQLIAALARFLCFQGFAVLVADFADESAVDADPHHGLSFDDFLHDASAFRSSIPL